MSDPIDRQAAIDAIAQYLGRMNRDFESWKSTARIILDHVPSAQPEIVHCKDCRYRMPYDWMFSEMWRSRNIDDYSEDEIGCKYCDMTMKADDFCSRAERRTDERMDV